MYIQITTRCNMRCAHCGFACTEKGHDMSFETFKTAIDNYAVDEYVTIGGGEPTIHPQFLQFLFYAIGKCENVWMVINGKITEIALALGKLSESTCLSVELSQDHYHEPIDPEVVKLFRKLGKIRDTSHHLIKAGRCKQGDSECFCNGPFVKPDGKVYQCGCRKSPCVGDVFDGFEGMNENEWDCYKDCQELVLTYNGY